MGFEGKFRKSLEIEVCFLFWLDVMWFCVSKVLLFVLSSKYMVIEICHRVYKWCNLGGWEKCWEQGVTPWDLGRPTPIILHLHQTGALPKGRALVPGCGSVSYFFQYFYDLLHVYAPPFFFWWKFQYDPKISYMVEFCAGLWCGSNGMLWTPCCWIGLLAHGYWESNRGKSNLLANSSNTLHIKMWLWSD